MSFDLERIFVNELDLQLSRQLTFRGYTLQGSKGLVFQMIHI